MEIKELDKNLIELANHCSFNGNRGKLREESYKSYVESILSWNISDCKKQKILNKLYDKNMEILKYEAQHVSVMVAGPAKYDARKFDKSDKILELGHNLYVWFEKLEKQVNKFFDEDKVDKNDNEVKHVLAGIKRFYELNFDPKNEIIKLASLDVDIFKKTFEEYNKIFKWRKNTTIYKLYEKALNNELKVVTKEIIFEDENFIAYIEGDRAYIKFVMIPQRQLIVALKRRKWWWNSSKQAWSTYLNRLDRVWVSNISKQYERYI